VRPLRSNPDQLRTAGKLRLCHTALAFNEERKQSKEDRARVQKVRGAAGSLTAPGVVLIDELSIARQMLGCRIVLEMEQC
jgi:hypothetical protein